MLRHISLPVPQLLQPLFFKQIQVLKMLENGFHNGSLFIMAWENAAYIAKYKIDFFFSKSSKNEDSKNM